VKVKQVVSNTGERSSNIRLLTRAALFAHDPSCVHSPLSESQSLEIKARTNPIAEHHAQALHYLTATGLRLALLLNFGAGSLQSKRIIRQAFFESV
jgi:hypothetical protein